MLGWVLKAVKIEFSGGVYEGDLDFSFQSVAWAYAGGKWLCFRGPVAL